MKRKLSLKLLWMIAFILSYAGLHAQQSTTVQLYPYTVQYACELRNFAQTNGKTVEFDIYLMNTATGIDEISGAPLDTMQYAGGQYGITVDPAFVGGGTVASAIVASSSGLSSMAENPTTITFDVAQNCIKIAARTPPGAGNGYIIPWGPAGQATLTGNNPATAVRVCRVRLTTTTSFGSVSPASALAWSFSVNPYKTDITAYVMDTPQDPPVPTSYTNVPVTNALWHTNLLATNAPLIAYTITGIGPWCAASGGETLGLSGSEVGVNYTLLKGATYAAGVVQTTKAGTGSAITFTGSYPAASYWIKAQRGAETAIQLTTAASVVPAATAGVPPTPGAITGTATVTAPLAAVPYSISAVSGATSYFWSYTGTGVTINNGTTLTPTLDFASGATSGSLKAYGVNVCGNSAVASTLAITVSGGVTAPTAYNVTGTGSYCAGGVGLPVGVANSETGVTYELWKDAVATGITVPGNTGSPVTFGNQLFGTYTVKGTNGGGTTPMTGSAVITENPLPTATITPTGSTTFCAGGSVLLTASAGTSWLWSPGGATTQAITATAAGSYTVQVTNASNCSATSAAVVVSVTTPVTPSVTIVASANPVNAGTSVTFTPTPVNGGSPTYQWYLNTVPTVTTPTYTFVPVNGDQVEVVMTTSLGCVTSTTAQSNPIVMTVNIVIPATSTWTGLGTANNWTDANNWNNGVPGAITAVTIPGGLTNYPTLTAPNTQIASILIQDGGSFIGSENLLVAPTAVTVKRNIVNTKAHFLSSPVVGAKFGPVFAYSLTTWARSYNPTTGGWVYKTALDVFNLATGYNVSTTTPTVTASFAGAFNAPPVSSGTLLTANGGWNLLGNPYTSAISWDGVVLANVNPSVAVWDGLYGTGAYKYYNSVTHIGIPASYTGIIPAENGFFVTATGAGASIQMPAASRTHNALTFLKESVANVLRLRADGNSYSDEMLVHFENNATAGFDDYDAKKLGEGAAMQLYSVADGNKLSMNSFPVAGNDVVDLGFSSDAAGTYSFSASDVETFDPATVVLLEDVKANYTQDLRTNPVYTFDYATGENALRFKLHFKSANGINPVESNGISVYSSNHNVMINNTTSLAGEVWVYDMTGRELTHTTMSSQMTTSIPMSVAIGTYTVKVVTAKSTVNQKLFIR